MYIDLIKWNARLHINYHNPRRFLDSNKTEEKCIQLQLIYRSELKVRQQITNHVAPMSSSPVALTKTMQFLQHSQTINQSRIKELQKQTVLTKRHHHRQFK